MSPTPTAPTMAQSKTKGLTGHRLHVRCATADEAKQQRRRMVYLGHEDVRVQQQGDTWLVSFTVAAPITAAERHGWKT